MKINCWSTFRYLSKNKVMLALIVHVIDVTSSSWFEKLHISHIPPLHKKVKTLRVYPNPFPPLLCFHFTIVPSKSI